MPNSGFHFQWNTHLQKTQGHRWHDSELTLHQLLTQHQPTRTANHINWWCWCLFIGCKWIPLNRKCLLHKLTFSVANSECHIANYVESSKRKWCKTCVESKCLWKQSMNLLSKSRRVSWRSLDTPSRKNCATCRENSSAAIDAWWSQNSTQFVCPVNAFIDNASPLTAITVQSWKIKHTRFNVLKCLICL